MPPRKLLITIGVLLAVSIPVGTVGVQVVPTPKSFARAAQNVPAEMKDWIRVAWQALREGRSMPVLLIDTLSRVVPGVGLATPQTTPRNPDGKEYLDDGGDTLLVPELKPLSPVQLDRQDNPLVLNSPSRPENSPESPEDALFLRKSADASPDQPSPISISGRALTTPSMPYGSLSVRIVINSSYSRSPGIQLYLPSSPSRS